MTTSEPTVTEQRLARELSGQDQHVVPGRQVLARHPHRRHRAIVTDVLQPVPRELLNLLVERFLRYPMDVRVEAQILLSIVGLRRLVRPSPNLLLVDEHRVRVVIDPGSELGQNLGVVVGAHARIDSVVPAVQATDEVVAFDLSIDHQGPSMQTSTVQYRHLVVVPKNHQIDARHQCVGRHAVSERAPLGDSNLLLFSNLRDGHALSCVK